MHLRNCLWVKCRSAAGTGRNREALFERHCKRLAQPAKGLLGLGRRERDAREGFVKHGGGGRRQYRLGHRG
eukprot:scaffold92751_cov28-Tisochrysis_lutea.AAC.3